jgi:magnesium and cobalt transporter
MNDESADSKTSSTPAFKKMLRNFLKYEISTRAELLALLHSAKNKGVLDNEALQMLEGVLEVNDMQARDLMIPRAQMVVVEKDAPPAEFIPMIVESGHSRFPVIGEDKDDVVGLLLAKDLLNYYNSSETDFHINRYLRPAVFVPESKRINVLLREFRVTRNHIAIVVDEYGGVAGIITMEDILENIVGEIADEYDEEPDAAYIKKLDDTHFSISALTPIEMFNEHFDATLNDEDFDTIGGLITQGFGHMPSNGESITIENYQFTVMDADERRINSVKMTFLGSPDDDAVAE